MLQRQYIYYIALLGFLITSAASLVIQAHIQASEHLAFIGGWVIAQYSLASLLMLLAWWRMPKNHSFHAIALLIVVAVLSRFLLLFVDPYTSNDVYRYLFDGVIALQGYDPYQLSHDSALIADLRQQWQPPAEHAKYVTLYPPLALALFSFAASFGVNDALLAWKILTFIASLLVLLLGYLVLRCAGKRQHFPLLALSPLLIFEAGEGLHIDIFSALAVIAAVYCWQSRQLKWMGLCIGIGGLIKVLPMFLLWPMLFILQRWKERFELVLSSIGVWAGGYGLTWLLGFQPIGSLPVFFEKWRSGSPLFLWLEPYLTAQQIMIILPVLFLAGLLLIAVVLYRLVLQNSAASTVSETHYLSLQAIMALPLILSPVIFPWYLLPVIVLLALKPNAFLLFWSLSLPLVYEVLGAFICCQSWQPANWPVHTIGVGFMIAAGVHFILIKKRKKPVMPEAYQ